MKTRIFNRLLLGAIMAAPALMVYFAMNKENAAPREEKAHQIKEIDTGAKFCPRCGWDSTIIFYTPVLKKHKKRPKK